MQGAVKISVIIPTLNQGEYIGQTMLSLAGQTYRNFEIIVIDGGSTDNTLKVIESHRQLIAQFVSEKDRGQSEAINKGLKMATGEVVTWLNSDDFYEPGTLQAVVDYFTSHPGVDILHGKAIFFGPGIHSKIIGPPGDLALHDYLAYMRFPQPSSFFKKTYLNQTFNLREHLHYAMDFDLVARAILCGAVPGSTGEVLSHYRLHPNSKSNHELKFAREWAMVVHQVLSSLHHGQQAAQQLCELGLVKDPAAERLPCRLQINETQTQSIFLQHLNLQYHCHYRNGHRNQCVIISTFLKQHHYSFYVKNNYKKYDFRLKFIPKFALDLVRNLRQ